jgi:hypothetical protein
LTELGEIAGARNLYEENLTVLRRVLGDEHPETQTTRRGLAKIDQLDQESAEQESG